MLQPQERTKRQRRASPVPPAESPPHPLDGATREELTGMRAEFTSKIWFDNPDGIRYRRLYSWYGYHGNNVSWRQMMTLLTQVYFPAEEDMRLPADRQEREDRTSGVRLTNLEKCLVTKMFLTTGMTFSKLAILWGCDEPTISAAIRYWAPRWHKVAMNFQTLPVPDGYSKPADWPRSDFMCRAPSPPFTLSLSPPSPLTLTFSPDSTPSPPHLIDPSLPPSLPHHLSTE